MLVSLKEIKKYVDLDGISPEEIANKLTSAGIEVEGIKTEAEGTNLVIGKILTCIPHPDSDHLHLCKVDIGTEILNIVCGAPNAREGIIVIVAKVGATLPGKEIKASEIRGQKSQGMLCSLLELGVDSKYLSKNQIEGIEELPSDAVVGNVDVLAYLGLDDVVLDLSLLANRSDAYSLYNVAKELGALFNRKVNIPTYKNDKLVENKYICSSNTNNCKAISTKLFTGVSIKDSPTWLKNILRDEGIRSINNIVDIGNYVMLLTGQPVNMYDAATLEKNELVVRDDYSSEILAMDDKKYLLKEGDLVVTSNNKIVCLAGIMTSKSSEVTSDSKNILVEIANFYGAQIRKTCIRLGISSDSSQRFIKGINPHQTDDVMNLIEHLIETICTCESISKTNSYDVLGYKDKEISCSFEYINERLGTNFSNEIIIDTLNRLYIKTIKVTKDGFVAVIPSQRIDIEGKADLSEEIIRFNGIDFIKSVLPEMETTVGGRSELGKKEEIIANYLSNLGLYRILTYTLTNKNDASCFNFINKNKGYEVCNPLTEDHKYVRTNLISSMLNAVSYNYNHQNRDFGFFEISQIDDTKEVSNHLSICLFGNKYEQDKIGGKAYNFFDMKGILEEILKMFNIQQTRIKYERLSDSIELHPNRSAKVLLDGKLLCVLGEIYPTLRDKYNFKKEAVVLCEMNLNVLFATKTGNNHFQEINKYPSVSRDYAFVINKDIKYSDLKSEVKKLSTLISSVNLFDIYEGEHLEKDKVSIAINVTFEAKDHTLKDDEISSIDEKIKATISSKFNATIRK